MQGDSLEDDELIPRELLEPVVFHRLDGPLVSKWDEAAVAKITLTHMLNAELQWPYPLDPTVANVSDFENASIMT